MRCLDFTGNAEKPKPLKNATGKDEIMKMQTMKRLPGSMKWLGAVTASALLLLAAGAALAAWPTAIQVGVGMAMPYPAEKGSKIAIADPTIVDIAPLSDLQVSIIGKKLGVTTLTVLRPDGSTTVIRTEVVNDAAGFIIRQMVGQPELVVRSVGDALVLDGKVDNELQMQRAVQLAGAYKDKVINLIEVTAPRQVLIRTRVAEVTTGALKQLGIEYFGPNGAVQYGYGRVDFSEGGGGQSAAHAFLNSSVQSISAGTIPVGVEATLRLLMQNNKARILSEPTLLTLSGKEASFLSGGEMPIVQQLQNTFTVEFKQFGVLMKIKPTVDSARNINTHISTEVSDINPNVTVQGVPSFSTRRAETDVQVKDGQTIFIGGLFSHSIRDSLRKFPWLAEIPVLGLLFRSKDFQSNRSELLIFVTPEVVKDIDVAAATAARTTEMKDWRKTAEQGLTTTEVEKVAPQIAPATEEPPATTTTPAAATNSGTARSAGE
jgi:pilus assembly protein CpaC